MPDLIDIELTASYARRDGDNVRIELVVDSTVPLDASEIFLRLLPEDDDGAEALRSPATLTRTSEHHHLTARFGAAKLGRGLWKLRLRNGQGGPLLFVRGRLLVTGPDQPLALLPGPRPTELMAPPGARRTAR